MPGIKLSVKLYLRFVIGKRGCVIKDIESRCGVKISFPEEEGSKDTSQVVVIKGDCNDDIKDAIVSYLILSAIFLFFGCKDVLGRKVMKRKLVN